MKMFGYFYEKLQNKCVENYYQQSTNKFRSRDTTSGDTPTIVTDGLFIRTSNKNDAMNFRTTW